MMMRCMIIREDFQLLKVQNNECKDHHEIQTIFRLSDSPIYEISLNKVTLNDKTTKDEEFKDNLNLPLIIIIIRVFSLIKGIQTNFHDLFQHQQIENDQRYTDYMKNIMHEVFL